MLRRVIFKPFLVLLLTVATVAPLPLAWVDAAQATQIAGGVSKTLSTGWALQSSAKVSDGGAAISTAGYAATGWYPVTVPSSVIGGLLQNNVYADPYFGQNFTSINAADFSVPWWYRTEFTLPASENGKRVWLKLEGLSYRANVWLNGTQISKSTYPATATQPDTIGQFRAFEIDITQYVSYSGSNALAVQVYRAVNPNNVGGDLGLTFVDWNPNAPDWNMGILNDVVVSTTGPVNVRNPLVVTNLPSLTTANLTVVAELRNGSGSSVSGTLQGMISDSHGNSVATFQQPVNNIAAGATQQVTFTPSAFSQLKVTNPDLWWPWQYGNPDLNTLTLTFATTDGTVSDGLSTAFGIRQITSTLNSSGSRVFSINGKQLLIRGGAWAPDIFQRRTPARQEAEIRYVRDLNLNTLRFEGKFEDDNMFSLADKYGLLVMIGWNCCDSWQSPGSFNSEQLEVAYESLKNQMYRLRNHPSMLVWLNGSDMPPSVGAYSPYKGSAAVEQQYINIETNLQWPNPVLSSASDYKSTVQTQATGVKMLGPYEWEPPIYWETDSSHQAGGAWSFATEVSPGPSVPPYDSLIQFIPSNHLWPTDSYWTYHCGASPFNNLNVFTTAMNKRYGTASSAKDYAERAQIMAYESHRAHFEAYGRNKYTSSGIIQWMLRNAWPSMIWHLYDYYMRPGGAYYGAKNALEPLHIQWSYSSKAVVVDNSTLQSYANLKAIAQIYNTDGTLKYNKTVTIASLAADQALTAFTVSLPSGLTTAYFLRLTLTDANNNVLSKQTYWLSTTADTLSWSKTTWYNTPASAYANFTSLQNLPRVNVGVTDQRVDDGTSSAHTVTVTNSNNAIVFFVHLKITKNAGGDELLPITWQDNYFTLLPGETRQVTAKYFDADLGGATPVVAVDTWNTR